jgi:6,7-dimethyl-8-ribityllumazine synthase
MGEVKKSKLLKSDAGILNNQDACIVLVKTEWNTIIVDELERGCIDSLKKNGISRIISLVVPGAVEIPFAIRAHWRNAKKSKQADAFIALGCVIRGDTPHFEYVSQSVTSGIMLLNAEMPVPTIFGVLTVDTEEQAKQRIGGIHGHKGEEAAITALKMIALNQSLQHKK